MATDHVVGKLSDIPEGHMKEVEAGDRPVLLANVKGTIYAVGNKCNHYGGPLPKGDLHGTCVTCPWHQARFDMTTGDLVDPPALNALPRFDVRIDGDDIVVTIPDEKKGRRVMDMAEHDPDADGRVFGIVGAGGAGHAAAEALRQGGYQGRIMMITRESNPPYDRPDLSKGYMSSSEPEFSPMLRSDKFYEKHGIEVLTERDVTRVDVAKKVIEFAGDHEPLEVDKLLLATGGRPKTLKNAPGDDLEGLFTLRSLHDAERISAAAEKASNAVVIGASFIGMELAASLTGRGLSVTVVAPEDTPFEKILGSEIGRVILSDHEKNGVSFRLGQKVVRFSGESKVEGVYIGTREHVRADLVVIGIGVEPVTDYVEGLELNDDGSIPVDGTMQAAQDVYAAGDIAEYPDARTGERLRIEHWRVAEQQGRVAAFNMAGKRTTYEDVPFFWTNHFDAKLRYVGHAKEWDEIVYHGDPESLKFVAFYVKDDRVLAAAGCGENKKMARIGNLLRSGEMPTAEELRSDQVDTGECLIARSG